MPILEEACAACRTAEIAAPVDRTLKIYGGPFLASEPDVSWTLGARDYIAAKRHPEALATYECCRRSLDQELGITPSPETAALAQSARQR